MILDKQFCSFKTKFEANTLCTNEYNLTGRCVKAYCPLSNGRYATIKEEDGKLFLCMKTIERAHSPANLWERIPLPDDIPGALEIINENLAYWPIHFKNKVKERLVRLHQCIIRYRKWYYRAKPRLVTVHKKFERREQRRELKALVAAKLDFAIKQELLERLKQGTYEPFINLNNKAYMEILKEEKRREKLLTKGMRKKTPTTAEGAKEKEAEVDGVSFEDGVEFVEAEDEEEEEDETVGDMEDFGGEAEEESEDEDEKELELEMEDDGQDELRMDILKHIPINLSVEKGDDEEMIRLKKRLLLKRKRKLEQKHEEAQKQSRDAQKKKKHYGPHVEIEYENQPSTSAQTNSW